MNYEVGDKITFTPSAVFIADNGHGVKERNERNSVTGIVTSINREHRWYRVSYKPEYDSEQHECFKF